jgi:hypothetical protein
MVSGVSHAGHCRLNSHFRSILFCHEICCFNRFCSLYAGRRDLKDLAGAFFMSPRVAARGSGEFVCYRVRVVRENQTPPHQDSRHRFLGRPARIWRGHLFWFRCSEPGRSRLGARVCLFYLLLFPGSVPAADRGCSRAGCRPILLARLCIRLAERRL